MKSHPVTKIESVFNIIPAKSISNQVFYSDSISSKIPHDYFTPCFSNFYSIAYCTKGYYKIRIDGNLFKLKAGDFMVFKPSEYYEFVEAKNYQGYLFSFTEDFLINTGSLKDYERKFSFLKRGNFNIIGIDHSKYTYFEDYFKGYDRIINSLDQPYRIEIIKNVLNSMLYELEAIYKDGQTSETVTSSRKINILEAFTDILEHHFKKQWTVKFYADKLCITPDYLGKIIRNTCGKTPVHLINERRALAAKHLLKSSDSPISQISEELNFSSPAGFSRFFVKLVGITPINYRKRIDFVVR